MKSQTIFDNNFIFNSLFSKLCSISRNSLVFRSIFFETRLNSQSNLKKKIFFENLLVRSLIFNNIKTKTKSLSYCLRNGKCQIKNSGWKFVGACLILLFLQIQRKLQLQIEEQGKKLKMMFDQQQETNKCFFRTNGFNKPIPNSPLRNLDDPPISTAESIRNAQFPSNKSQPLYISTLIGSSLWPLQTKEPLLLQKPKQNEKW